MLKQKYNRLLSKSSKKLKMKVLLALSFILLIQVSSAQAQDFYDAALEPKTGGKNFIVLDIDSSSYKGRAAIENADLYVFLKIKRGINETAYINYVKDLIANNKKLYICDSEKEEFNFIPIKNIKEINDYASKGKEKFLKHYFRGKLMDSAFTQGLDGLDVMYAVADKLFEWKIVTYQDDLSGLLAIWGYGNSKY